MHEKLVVIGGGAAGFFCAVNAARLHPDLQVLLVEKSNKLLAKVKVSGGGRCNTTHACFELPELVQKYPRGQNFLKKTFHWFNTNDTIEWFAARGVDLKTEADGRMFPTTNNSQTIIDCFLGKTKALGIPVLKNHGVTSIKKQGDSWLVTTKEQQFVCDAVVMAAGSSKKVWDLSQSLGHAVISPVPSLFTFNIKDIRIKDLLGISVSNATVKLIDTNLEASGPLLITHWGMSGPAILKLSAFSARLLAECQYETTFVVSWLGDYTEDQVRALFEDQIKHKPMAQLSSFRLPEVPKRLWLYLLDTLDIPSDKRWNEFSKKLKSFKFWVKSE